MRILLILYIILITFVAEAQDFAADMSANVNSSDKNTVIDNSVSPTQPVYLRYEPKKASTERKIETENNKADSTVLPEEAKSTVSKGQTDLKKTDNNHVNEKQAEEKSDVKKHRDAYSKHHQHRYEEPPSHKNTHKSRFNMHVDIGVAHPAAFNNTYVYSQPVKVLRPRIYDNDIYTRNSYSCQERYGVKYCTDYRGRALTGKIVQTYGDNVAYEQYRNGYQHGQTTVFDANGVLVRKSDYKKSLKDGKEYVYYTNGRIEYVAEYKKGALHGKVLQYDDRGKKIGQITYRNGRLNNRQCVYETYDPMILAQVKQKNYNELILCADYAD